MDIEILATSAVKDRLALCDGLYSYVNEREKEPSFDGNIYVYPKGTNRKELQIGRVPVQIKGESKRILGGKTTYKHSAEISDLKIYLKDGGVIYFVVVINDEGNEIIFKKKDLSNLFNFNIK